MFSHNEWRSFQTFCFLVIMLRQTIFVIFVVQLFEPIKSMIACGQWEFTSFNYTYGQTYSYELAQPSDITAGMGACYRYYTVYGCATSMGNLISDLAMNAGQISYTRLCNTCVINYLVANVQTPDLVTCQSAPLGGACIQSGETVSAGLFAACNITINVPTTTTSTATISTSTEESTTTTTTVSSTTGTSTSEASSTAAETTTTDDFDSGSLSTTTDGFLADTCRLYVDQSSCSSHSECTWNDSIGCYDHTRGCPSLQDVDTCLNDPSCSWNDTFGCYPTDYTTTIPSLSVGTVMSVAGLLAAAIPAIN